VLDNSVPLLLRAGQKARNILERDQRNIERVTEPHKPRALHRRIDVQHARQHRRLIGHDANRLSAEARKSHHDIFREVLLHLEEIVVIRNRVDQVLDVIGLDGIRRHK
jgi:hypothetical protein